MAVEILRGERINNDTIAPKQSNDQESLLGTVGRNIYRGTKELTKLVGLPGTLAQAVFPKESEKVPLPTMQGIEENIYKPFEDKYLPEGYGKPKGTAEEISDMMFASIPFIVSGGLPLAAGRAAGALTSSLGIKGAEHLGAGPIGQLAAGIATGSLPRFLKHGVGFGGIRNKIIADSEKNYKAAEPFAKKYKMPAKNYENNINAEWDKLHGGNPGIGKDDIKRVAHELEKMKGDIIGGKIGVKAAWDKKKHLNNLLKQEQNPAIQNYYKRFVGNTKGSVLEPASKKYPQFGVPFNAAEDMHIGAFAPNKLRKILEKNTKLESLVTSPLAKMGLLGMAGGALKLVGAKAAAGGIAGALGTRYLLRAGDMFAKSQEARNIMKDISQAALNDDIGALGQYLSLFNKEAEKYEKDTTGIEFVQGGFNPKHTQAKR